MILFDRRDRAFIALCVLTILAGAAIFRVGFSRAFPEASIDFKVTREEALRRGADALEARGFALDGTRALVIFDGDDEAKVYLERTLGLEKANPVFATTVPVWRWSMRWVRPLAKLEYRAVFLRTDGFSRFGGFCRRRPRPPTPERRRPARSRRRRSGPFAGSTPRASGSSRRRSRDAPRASTGRSSGNRRRSGSGSRRCGTSSRCREPRRALVAPFRGSGKMAPGLHRDAPFEEPGGRHGGHARAPAHRARDPGGLSRAGAKEGRQVEMGPRLRGHGGRSAAFRLAQRDADPPLRLRHRRRVDGLRGQVGGGRRGRRGRPRRRSSPSRRRRGAALPRALSRQARARPPSSPHAASGRSGSSADSSSGTR